MGYRRDLHWCLWPSRLSPTERAHLPDPNESDRYYGRFIRTRAEAVGWISDSGCPFRMSYIEKDYQKIVLYQCDEFGTVYYCFDWEPL